MDPHSTNIISERRPDRHAVLRYKLAPGVRLAPMSMLAVCLLIISLVYG